MEFQSYNAELGIANLLFQRLFNNIRIERTANNGEKTQIKVGCVMGQRSRILKNLQNPEKRGNLTVPMIIIERQGFQRQGDRLNNLHNEVKYELTSAKRLYELMAPIPIDINYNVTLIAKYPQDLDKIESNFMVFFNSDLFVSFEHPKYEGLKINSQVIMADSVTEENLSELDATQDDLVSSQFSFTFKTYLFAGTSKAKIIHPQVVSSYTSSFISSVVVEIQPDEIDKFQLQHPTQPVSALSSVDLTTTISTYIDDISSEIYDNVPIIGNLDFGFYAIPKQNEIIPYMQSVDNEQLVKHEDFTLYGEISSGYYVPVDTRCSLEPYVDKIYWAIDGSIEEPFPNNVGIMRHN